MSWNFSAGSAGTLFGQSGSRLSVPGGQHLPQSQPSSSAGEALEGSWRWAREDHIHRGHMERGVPALLDMWVTYTASLEKRRRNLCLSVLT